MTPDLAIIPHDPPAAHRCFYCNALASLSMPLSMGEDLERRLLDGPPPPTGDVIGSREWWTRLAASSLARHAPHLLSEWDAAEGDDEVATVSRRVDLLCAVEHRLRATGEATFGVGELDRILQEGVDRAALRRMVNRARPKPRARTARRPQ